MQDYRTGGSQDRCEVITVKGERGANAVKIPPNSSCLTMDIDDPVVYLIKTDSTGYPSVEAYKIERIPTASEKAASAIEQVTQALSNISTQMSDFGERLMRLEAQFK